MSHLDQAFLLRHVKRVAVGILYPEARRRIAVFRGIGARVHDVGPDRSQSARQTREDARVVGQHEIGAGDVAVLIGL